MKKYEGQGVKEALKKLLELPAEEQPFITITLEGKGDRYAGVKIIPTGSVCMLDGNKIKVGFNLGGFVKLVWNAEGQETWPGEVIIKSIEY